MSKEEFTLNLPAPTENLFKIATKYENYQKFFEGYLKSVTIIEKNENKTKTKEVFFFKSLFNHEMIQESIHTTKENCINTEVVEGPFKGTILETLFNKTETGTQIKIIIDYKIGLKYKILAPIIKQKYKIIATGLLYKMNTLAMTEN